MDDWKLDSRKFTVQRIYLSWVFGAKHHFVDNVAHIDTAEIMVDLEGKDKHTIRDYLSIQSKLDTKNACQM